MTVKSVPWWVWLLPIAVLLIATARLPYGYNTFTRIVVCVMGSLFAFLLWNAGRIGQVLAVAVALIAVLFNPIIPVHLNRTTWFYLDIIAAAVFALGIVCAHLRGRRRSTS
jgi:hypothetical protein